MNNVDLQRIRFELLINGGSNPSGIEANIQVDSITFPGNPTYAVGDRVRLRPNMPESYPIKGAKLPPDAEGVIAFIWLPNTMGMCIRDVIGVIFDCRPTLAQSIRVKPKEIEHVEIEGMFRFERQRKGTSIFLNCLSEKLETSDEVGRALLNLYGRFGKFDWEAIPTLPSGEGYFCVKHLTTIDQKKFLVCMTKTKSPYRPNEVWLKCISHESIKPMRITNGANAFLAKMFFETLVKIDF